MSSLKKGGDIILQITNNLSDQYKVLDILIDKDETWHAGGVPINPGDLVHKIDVAWNTAHPRFSNILESLSIPEVGNSSFSATLENSKDLLRDHMERVGVSMPRYLLLPVYQKDFDGPKDKYSMKKAMKVFEKFSAPWLVKSFINDSTMGVHLAKTYPELVQAIEDGVKHGQSILVEEFIVGKVASMHSVPDFRGQDIYTFPLGKTFGVFSAEEKGKLESLVKGIYNHVGGRHYLKSNFVLTPKGKVYLTHIESTPDFKEGSHFYEVCDSVGAKMHHVIEHILEEALK